MNHVAYFKSKSLNNSLNQVIQKHWFIHAESTKMLNDNSAVAFKLVSLAEHKNLACERKKKEFVPMTF